MLKKIFLTLAVLLVGFAAYVAILPSAFRVTRTGTIGAPPAEVFAMVNNLKRWNDWSPWAKVDPKAKNSFEGPEEGVGAAMSWDGNDDVGAGKMTIVESKPNELIRMKLAFTRPMAGESDTEFFLSPDNAGGTKVTWSIAGHNDFMSRAICVFMDMDKMIGGMYEKGFENMNAIVAKK